MNAKYTPEEIQELAYKWRMGTISAAEKQVYEDWYNQHDDSIGTLEESWGTEETIRTRLWLDISAKMQDDSAVRAQESSNAADVPVFYRFYKSNVFRVAAAAIVLLLCYFGFKDDKPMVTMEVPTIAIRILEPGLDDVKNATLLLTSGKKLDLDQLQLGEVVHDRGFRINKVGARKIVYTASNTPPVSGYYSQDIVLPKHVTYEVVLADGTQVWMNSWSKLRVFDNLSSSRRTVELEGEAYFEVAKTKAQASFTVKTANQEVNVLGTHFNVQAYPNSPTKTSLLEGSVRVVGTKKMQSVVLEPGQEALSKADMHIRPFNVEEVLAWKDDVFYFNSMNLKEVLEELARWYPLAVDYEMLPKDLTFSGKVSRNRSLLEILDAIERTSHVKFKLAEGRLNFEK